MDHILTRVVRRVSSACDEWLERVDDHEHGRRDRWGRRNQYWHEHEYEKQRRSEKRRAQRKEHEARAIRKKEKGKGKGKGKEEGSSAKPAAVEAMMTGALRGGDSRDGSGTPAGSRRSHASAAPVPEADTAAVVRNEAEQTTREPGATEEPEPPAGGSASRDISPMPSEQSISSIRARAEAEAAAKAKAQANADRENPPLAIDSEDEVAKSSDDDSSDEEDEAAEAAKKAKEPATEPRAGEPSGIRGGGAESDDGEDKDEYYEPEDFDEEYQSTVPPDSKSTPPVVDEEAEAGPSSRAPPSRERRPYIVRGGDLPKTEDVADRQDERVPERSRRPYHSRGIIPDEASTETGSSNEQRNKKGKRSEARQQKSSSKKAEPSQPNAQAKRAAKPKRDRWANFSEQYKAQEQYRYAQGPRRTRRAKFSRVRRQASWQPSAYSSQLPCRYCGKDYNAHCFSNHHCSRFSPKWEDESKSTSSEPSSDSSDSETESEEIPESCRNWRYVKTPESSRKAESSKRHKPQRKMESSSESDQSAPEPPRKQKSKGKSRGKGKARAKGDEPPPPQYDSISCPQNHYAALGLREDATTEQVKSAARKLRIQTHPDRLVKPGMSNEDICKITKRSMRVGEAADVLCDEEKKDEYDDEIWQWKQKHGGVLPKEPDIS